MSDWAGVLEVWTWTYYSAEANSQKGRRMHHNTHIVTQKLKENFWGGDTSTWPLPNSNPGSASLSAYAQNPFHTFSRNFPVNGIVANLLLATSRCNGIWETTRHNRHNGLLPAPTSHRLVVDLSFMLRTCYGEVDNLLQGN